MKATCWCFHSIFYNDVDTGIFLGLFTGGGGGGGGGGICLPGAAFWDSAGWRNSDGLLRHSYIILYYWGGGREEGGGGMLKVKHEVLCFQIMPAN